MRRTAFGGTYLHFAAQLALNEWFGLLLSFRNRHKRFRNMGRLNANDRNSKAAI